MLYISDVSDVLLLSIFKLNDDEKLSYKYYNKRMTTRNNGKVQSHDKENRSGYTPVHYAAGLNLAEAIAMLIDHGAMINILDNGGNTPVHYAAGQNSSKASAMLIDHGASINIANNRADKPIDTASL